MAYLEILNRIFGISTVTAQIVSKGCKKVIPSNTVNLTPSFIQNMDTVDATLVYEDQYGNIDTITLVSKEATYFQVAKVMVGSASKLYQLYSL